MWKLKIAEGDEPWLLTTNNHVGRQYWEFNPEAGTAEERADVERAREQFKKNRLEIRQSSDLLMRMQLSKENTSIIGPSQPTKTEEGDEESFEENSCEKMVSTALRRAVNFYSTIQAHDGHWPSESSGPLFFLQPLVIVLYVIGAIDEVLSLEHQKEIIRYLFNHQNEDGGWGLHTEGDSTMFGSCLSYVALRLLGKGQEDGDMARAHKWIINHGGAVTIPSWGKFWLAILGAYEWEGCKPMPPEIWLLPSFFPINPGVMVSFGRLALMPTSYLYGKKFIGPITEIVRSLRTELYIEPYQRIDWNKARNTCAKEDLYYPYLPVQDMLWGFCHYFYEPIVTRWPFSKLREKALSAAMEHIHYEDENSRYMCIGSIEKVLCLLACYVESPKSEAYKRHLARIPDYLWVAEDGMKMQSFSSQTWDVALAVQAIMSTDLSKEYGQTIRKAHDFLKASQVRDNPSGNFTKMYRHICKGSWTFDVRDQGWQVSDCTAEALKAVLLISQMSPEIVGKEIEKERLHDAVDVILSLQSSNGGFLAWEPQRGFKYMEKVNPMEFLEAFITELEYVEGTSAAVQALVLFKVLHPGHRADAIDNCISKSIKYIEETQNPDGSWYGTWGICYTYGTWFAVRGLVSSGQSYHDSGALRKACKFLLSKQLPDGGWGESYLSSWNKVYTNLPGNRSNLVQTSWALLALVGAGQAHVDPEPVQRGMKLLITSQMKDGDFPQQESTGVFMRNCTLNYGSYRNIFPIWALGECQHVLKS